MLEINTHAHFFISFFEQALPLNFFSITRLPSLKAFIYKISFGKLVWNALLYNGDNTHIHMKINKNPTVQKYRIENKYFKTYKRATSQRSNTFVRTYHFYYSTDVLALNVFSPFEALEIGHQVISHENSLLLPVYTNRIEMFATFEKSNVSSKLSLRPFFTPRGTLLGIALYKFWILLYAMEHISWNWNESMSALCIQFI